MRDEAIVITGIGVISAIGTDRQSLIEGLLKGVSGIRRPELFNLPRLNLLGEARDFNPKKFIHPLKARRMSRFSMLALCSAIEAVNDSGMAIDEGRTYRIGIIVGTGLSSTESTDTFYEGLLQGGLLNVNPMIFPETVQNIAASQIAIYFGIKGQSTTFSQNETSSELALFYGVELLKDGKADAIIVTGAEEMSIATLQGFISLGVLTKKSGMMPFDRRRDGFVPGEGAATVVLERLEDALKRNAKVYGEIASIRLLSEPVERLDYDSSGDSMIRAMEGALKEAGVDKVDMISASANSSVALDMVEATAIRKVFGNKVPVTAIRAYTGFFLSDGILRLVATILSMKKGCVPEILNSEELEGGSDFLDYVVGGPRKKMLDYAIVNSFSSGGSAASVLLERKEF